MGRWKVPLALLVLCASTCFGFDFTKGSYNASIYENSRGKTYLRSEERMGVETGDLPLEVKYKIIAGDKDKFFKAEERRVGDFAFLMIRIRTGTTDVLNRERKDKYTLQIRATFILKTDQSTEASEQDCTVYVSVLDRNDLNPLFYPTEYEEVVPEDMPLHKSVLKINAEDADLGMNGEIYYYIEERTEQFSLHPTTGVITLTRHLRYSEKSYHQLTVVARDRGGGKPSFGKVKIHVKQVNLFGPEIYVHYLPEIVENSNTDVYAIVRVLDQDEGVHGEIRNLEIVDGDPDGNFKIRAVKQDLATGYEYNIEVLRLLDREASPKGYNLTLKAMDSGSPPRFTYKSVAVVLTDINDNPPVFDKDFYEVQITEITPVNSPILRVKVMDADLGPNAATQIEIISGNKEGRFAVNSDTGMLYTVDWLDAEEVPFYTLTIAATEKGNYGTKRQSTTVVKINIIDSNDNDPVFEESEVTVYINENEPAGTSVTKITATDADSGENSYISYSIANLKPVPFEIEHFSGLVRTTQVLDFESMKRDYILKIRASDWGLPYRRQTEMQLKIIVKEVNDNRPQFEKVDCIGNIPRYVPIGSEIITVSAIDFDAGNIISYRMIGENEDECFILDSTSGILTLTCDLSEVKDNQRNISITATDHTHFADPMAITMKFITSKKTVSIEPKNWFQCKDTGVTRRLTEVLASAEKNNMNKEEFAMMPSRYGQNYHSPELINFPTIVQTNESVPIGTVLAKMLARDRDLGYNGKLIFGISAGDPESRFRLDPETGELKVIGYLDREKETKYILNVTVFDLGKPKKSTSKLLEINVLDVNDNPPRFEKSVASFRVTENAVNGTAIFTANATDADLGENSNIAFSLVTDTESFRVHSKTGVLYVAGQLDREEQDKYELIIRATDSASTHNRDALYSEALVKIFIDDVNDNPPRFPSENYRVKIPEDLPPGVVVAIITAEDRDLEEGGVVEYSLSDETDTFTIDKMTGTIRTKKSMDYEKKQSYGLMIKAEDRGLPSLGTETFLTVDVVDVNENEYAPLFPELVVAAQVDEGLPVQSLVTQVVATDADPPGDNSKVHYTILGGDGVGSFRIDNQGRVTTTSVLDAETKDSYWITIVAQDSGVVPLQSSLQMYIKVKNVNDEAPLTELPVYYCSVMEDTPPNTQLLTIKAFDRDPDVRPPTFTISAGNPLSFFIINSTTGVITTTGRKLDREQQDEHILEITVNDNGVPPLSSTTTVVIKVEDLNDNDPEFDQAIYHITVPETRHKGLSVIQVLAFDKDDGENGTITYSLKSGNGKVKFSIHPTLGILYSQRPLAAGQQYNLLILASDNGQERRNSTARVSIKVLPIPKTSTHSPVIKKPEQSIHLTESDTVGYLVMLVQAQDIDEDTLWYNITDGDPENRFMIGRDKGNIQLARPLDRETKSEYNLTVSVTDGVHTAYTQLYVKVLDVNEHRPLFSKQLYTMSIPESTPIGKEILRLRASDLDVDNKVVFNIHNAQSSESLANFKVDYQSGALTIANLLDREAISQHILTVVVRDGGTPAKRNFARVIINITDTNDYQPQFSVDLIEKRIYNTAAVGSSLGSINAVDKDHGQNGVVQYIIISGNIGNQFLIDNMMGEITLAREFDVSSPSEYTITVKAIDSGIPPLFTTIPVHILVLNPGSAPPKFAHEELSAEVLENSPPGTVVTQLETSGWGLVYEISKGNINSGFTVNPTTGIVLTNKELDREKHSIYHLTISANNMAGEKSFCMLTVHVLDRNDNAPEFMYSNMNAWIVESAPVGSFLMDNQDKPLVATAIDKDLHNNALLEYHFVNRKHSSMFYIDSTTGAIRTVVCLDYEKMHQIIVPITVSDKGKPQLTSETTASVTITIIDVNDCPPIFTRDIYNATVLLPTYENVIVAQINATDADSPNLTELTYSIAEGSMQEIYDIESNTGVILIKNKYKGEKTAPHKFIVAVSDGKYTSEAVVNVNWVPIKPNGLSFPKTHYDGAVLENSSQIINIAIVSVRGTKLNEHVAFSILNPLPEFTIGKTSGAIRTTGIPLDREVKETYTFIVQAISEEQENDVGMIKVARVEVNITVLDVNDNCPVIVKSPYHAVVALSARKHFVITKVTALDLDKGENGEVRYELENGPAELFRVCPKSGNISLKQILPKSEKSYTLTIAAHDNGMPPCTNRVYVYIAVLDQQTPVFEQQYYNGIVSEDVPLHSPIPLSIKALSPLKNDIMYTISKGNEYEEFQTDFSTGTLNSINPCVIIVEDLLDYETQPEYFLTIRATDTITGKFSEVPLHLSITDANDNPPTFDLSHYNVSVLETLQIGNLVTKISAQDNDTGVNAHIQYSIEQEHSDSASYFYIKPDDGSIFLKKPLDYETKRTHYIVARAYDSGLPSLSSSVQIQINVLDVLDTAPQLEGLFTARLFSGNAKRGQFVSHIRAVHNTKLADLSYSLLTANHEFHLDKKNGFLTVANPKNITYSTYTLNVTVSDGVYTSFSKIKINILPSNLHSPSFERLVYEVGVKENLKPGSIIVKLRAIDEDPGIFGVVNYKIMSDSLKKYFQINETTGEVSTKVSFDREVTSSYEIPIMAQDGGFLTSFTILSVSVIDVNDNAPVFLSDRFFASILPNTTINSEILQIIATDSDDGLAATIEYSIYEPDDGDIFNFFMIDENNGQISTIASLGNMGSSVYEFFVRASDRGSPSRQNEVPVTIYIIPSNEELPTFEESETVFFLSEASDTGSVITTQKVLQDISIKYSILGESADMFNIDSEGQIILGSPLDRETTSTHKLAIIYETTSKPPLVSMRQVTLNVLDVNDNKPIFQSSRYELTIPEDIPIGTSILKVIADDKDEGINGEIHYWLEDSVGLFSIDRVSGWITTITTLDREKQTDFSITALAGDSGNPALTDRATIHIKLMDVNDNPPVFKKKIWNTSVPEDAIVGSTILTLYTTDADLKPNVLSYYITMGDSQSQFMINSEGDLCVSKILDREQISEYNLTVVVSDGKFAAFTTILITILDVNDEQPECLEPIYKVQLSEGSHIGTHVIKIKAYDPDTEPNILFRLSGINSDHFSINEVTGDVKTKMYLDREKISEYLLTAWVEDKDKTNFACSSIIHISILDINDNRPLFESKNLTTSVMENSPPGSLVTKIRALDADIGINSKVRYLLTDSANGQFEIISKTGVILISKILDRETQDSYNLTVEVIDQGIPQLSSSMAIAVNVLDVNDNPPVFLQASYACEIVENVLQDTEILKVKASSIDIGINAEILYTIGRGNEEGHFFMDPQTGVISVIHPLDYEHIKDYVLTVEATDRGIPPLSSQAFVNITILDFNDNPPIFTQGVYSVSIPEDIHTGSSVIQVSATDRDTRKNGLVTYSIEKGDPHQQFNVDLTSGFITVQRPLDREMIPDYKLLIRATDSGNPPLSTITTVILELLDVNDNPPIFTQRNYSSYVQEGKEAGWPVLQLSVTDADSESNSGPYTFDIRGGNGAGIFRITNEGTVCTVARLTHRVQQSYTLHIRVFDSGTPPLYSDTNLTIKVIEESQYPPSVTPKDILVMSYEDNIKGCSLGFVHATDLDQYDTLVYSIESETDNFQINFLSGELTISSLDSGHYKVNISVSDGKFTSYAIITVTVRPIWTDMLLSAFSIRLRSVSPKNFILSGRKRMLNALKAALKTEVLILSMQHVNNDLDILVSVQGGIDLELINKVLLDIGLPLVDMDCNCHNGGICRQRLLILPQQILTTETDINSFVAPSYKQDLYCACTPAYTGEKCELSIEEACDCPPPMVCSHQNGITSLLTCTSPPPVASLCALNHTCHSSNQHTLNTGTISNNFLWIIIAVGVLIILTTIIVAVIVKTCLKKRQLDNLQKREEKEAPVILMDSVCSSKIINIQTTKCSARPSSGSTEPVYSAVPLNNFDSICSYGSAGDELESIAPHYVRNLNPAVKITNELKGVADISTRPSRHMPNVEETRLMTGYSWGCTPSDWMHSGHSPLANITEVPGIENESSSLHSNDSNNHQPAGQVNEPLLRNSSGEEVFQYGFPRHSDVSVALCDIEEPGTIS